jgi:hypothetical protein
MRYGAKTEATHRLPDRYEIKKICCELFESTDRTGSFLD